MSTLNVVLTEKQQDFVAALVQSGRYRDVSEVVDEALRLIESRDADDTIKLERLRAEIDVGIAAIERGDYVEFSDPESMNAYLSQVAKAAMTEGEAE